jgi:serine/threonine protein kinase
MHKGSKLSEPVIKPPLKITQKYRRSGLDKIKIVDPLALFEKLNPYYSAKRLVGKGAFGSTYIFSGVKPGFYDAIAAASRGHVITRQHQVFPASCVAVKVVMHTNTRDVFAEFDREVYILNYMQKKKKIVLGNRVFRASDHVPKLYLACHLPGVSFIVESCASGEPLSTVSPRAHVIAKLELAVLSLWLSGVSHTDLTSANIMYDDASGKVTIIDFGRAVLLSPETVHFMKRNLLALATSPSRNTTLLLPDVLSVISKNTVSESARKAYRKYKIKGHFDDETMVRRQITRCATQCSQQSLAKERLHTWVPRSKKAG